MRFYLFFIALLCTLLANTIVGMTDDCDSRDQNIRCIQYRPRRNSEKSYLRIQEEEKDESLQKLFLGLYESHLNKIIETQIPIEKLGIPSRMSWNSTGKWVALLGKSKVKVIKITCHWNQEKIAKNVSHFFSFYPSSFYWSSNGQWFIAVNRNNQIVIYKVEKKCELYRRTPSYRSPLKDLVWCNTKLLALFEDGTLNYFDSNELSDKNKPVSPRATFFDVNTEAGIHFSFDEKKLIWAQRDRDRDIVVIYDFNKRTTNRTYFAFNDLIKKFVMYPWDPEVMVIWNSYWPPSEISLYD